LTKPQGAIKLQVEVIGDNSVAWCKHSGIISGEDAVAIREMINDISLLHQFSFPKPNGELVVLNNAVLQRTIITVEVIDETTD